MTSSKISKIVINKFGEYHGEIILKNCTLINCVYLESKEIDDLAIILKFMFASEPISIEDFPNITNVPESDCPYVEAHIKISSDITCVMRKSYKNGELLYEIDEIETTAKNFNDKLRTHGCLFSYTWFIKQKTIENVITYNDIQRAELIENVCGNSDLKLLYNKHKTHMEGLEMEMKFLNDHKKEFLMEKKMEKINIENSKKIKQAVKEYEHNFAQLALLKLYNNNNKLNVIIPEKITRYEVENEILESNYAEQYVQLKEILKQNRAKEKEAYISETSVTDVITEIIECKKNLLLYQNELDSLPQQMKYFNVIKNQHNKISALFNHCTQKLKELGFYHKKYSKAIEEFEIMENNFRMKHPDYTLYEMCQDQVTRIDWLKGIIKSYEAQLDLSVKEESFCIKQLIRMQNNEKILDTELCRLNEKIIVIGNAFKTAENFIKKGNKMIISLMEDQSLDIDEIKIIEQKLCEQFKGSIIGILSQLFDVQKVNEIELTKNQILKALGKYSNAIVVENLSVMREISDFLKMLQYDKMEQILLIPQNHFPLPKFLKDLQSKAPENVKISPLEEFLRPTTTEIMKILMHILQPMAICDCKSKEDVQKVFEHFGKTISVASFDAGITFRPPNHIIEVYSSTENENEYSLTEWIEKIIEKQDELNSIRIDLEVSCHERFLCINQLNTLKPIIKLMNELMEHNKMKKIIIGQKIAKLTEYTSKENDKNFEKVRDAYHRQLQKFQPLLEDYFRDFFLKYKFPSILVFEIVCFYDKIHKFLSEFVASINNLKDNLSKFVKNYDWQEKKHRLELEIEILTILEKELVDSIDFAKSLDHDRNTEWMKTIKRFDQAKSDYINSKIKMKTGMVNINAAKFEPKLLMVQNYQLLNNILMEYETIPLKNGTLMTLSYVPVLNDVDENFDLVAQHLHQIEFNFDALSDDLKNAEDIEVKIREMKNIVDSLKHDLRNYPLDFGSDETGLTSINEKLNNLSMEIRNKNTQCQKVLGALKSVTDERTKRFNECVKTINKEIEKFCRVIFSGRVTGELMPTNENYLESLQYLWQSAAKSEYINETSDNWHASLAFILGILSYKQQQFFAYFEESSKYPILYALQKYCASRESNLQSMIFWRTGIQETLCHNTIMRYNNKMNIVDNGKADKRLKELLRK